MLKHLSRQVSFGWWTAAAIAFLIFVGVVFPIADQVYTRLTPPTINPDVLFFYRITDLMQMGYALEFSGRIFFMIWHFTFDLVWPFLYFVMLFFTVSRVYRAFDFPMISVLLAMPLFTFLSDVGENAMLTIGMYYFPQRTIFLEYAPYFTLAKWSFAGISLALIVIGVLMHLILAIVHVTRRTMQRG
ncbi:MAG: hypothetical protein ACRDBX_07360 [Erysipelotrichaceae bacterium]